MKSLTEAQLHEMLTKAWEEGGWAGFEICSNPYSHESIENPSIGLSNKREEFFQKLIDEV